MLGKGDFKGIIPYSLNIFLKIKQHAVLMTAQVVIGKQATDLLKSLIYKNSGPRKTKRNKTHTKIKIMKCSESKTDFSLGTNFMIFLVFGPLYFMIKMKWSLSLDLGNINHTLFIKPRLKSKGFKVQVIFKQIVIINH